MTIEALARKWCYAPHGDWPCKMCDAITTAVREALEEAYREGSYQGKMRFTQAKVKEAVEAFREQVEKALPEVPDEDFDGETYRQECVAAIRALRP